MALTMGQIEGLTIKDYGRVKHADFSGRDWAWVDPLRDVEAAKAEIEPCLNTRSNVARDRGKDFTKLVSGNQADQEAMIDAGLAIENLPVPVEEPVMQAK